MNIDKNNIEEYIFDYLEGNLKGEELEGFKSYVNSNPDANAELNNWKQTYVISNSTVNSAEFSSLKKSNKMFYWAGGIAAAFMLGVGTMAIISGNENSHKKMESIIEVNNPIENINRETKNIELIETKEDDIIITTSDEISEDKTSDSYSEIEILEDNDLPEENIELTEQLDVSLEPSETNRKAKLKAIKIKKKEVEVKKKKETDVIDIETGF